MIYEKACQILDILPKHTPEQLKKQYYKLALKYHPDKNTTPGTCELFSQINEAYLLLTKDLTTSRATTSNNNIYYDDLNNLPFPVFLRKIISFIEPNTTFDAFFIDTTINSLMIHSENMSLYVFEHLSSEKMGQIRKFILMHNNILGFTNEFTDKINHIFEQKIACENLYILSTSIEDILNGTIFKLDIADKVFYIPLWHHELHYDIDPSKNLIVKISLEEISNKSYKNASIDMNNNLFFTIDLTMAKLWEHMQNNTSIPINLGNKHLEIDINDLSFKLTQQFTFYNKGIYQIDKNNIFNIENRADIIITINLLNDK